MITEIYFSVEKYSQNNMVQNIMLTLQKDALN